MVAPGGYALEDHWANGAALPALRGGRFDVVVLQQGPSSLPESRVNLIEWAKRWADEARAHDTRPAVLTVWPERERFSVFADVVRNYRDAARGGERAAPARRAGLAERVPPPARDPSSTARTRSTRAGSARTSRRSSPTRA